MKTVTSAPSSFPSPTARVHCKQVEGVHLQGNAFPDDGPGFIVEPDAGEHWDLFYAYSYLHDCLFCCIRLPWVKVSIRVSALARGRLVMDNTCASGFNVPRRVWSALRLLHYVLRCSKCQRGDPASTPAAPPFVNTLRQLTKWNGYWVYYLP